MSPSRRKILICVTDSDSSQEAVEWAMRNVYKQGDEVHLMHVIPRLQLSGAFGTHPGDILPHHDRHAHETLIKNAEAFIAQRALSYMDSLDPPPVVHIVKYETDSDSIGSAICQKAEDLKAAVTVLARQDKTKIQQFFLGSVGNYYLHHCKYPVLIH